MIDSKSVMFQVQKLQVIIHDLLDEDMIINEALQMVASIRKLFHLLRDFMNQLKCKRKKMVLEDLIVHLQIEEDNKIVKKRKLL